MSRPLLQRLTTWIALPPVGGPPARAAAYRTSLLLIAAIFLIDLWLPALVALGVLYVLPVLISVWGFPAALDVRHRDPVHGADSDRRDDVVVRTRLPGDVDEPEQRPGAPAGR